MLRSLNDLERYTVEATDGKVGPVVDFLIEDTTWVVRYLVVETGTPFKQRQVLVSPMFFLECDWKRRHFNLDLAKERVRQSPDVDLYKPVSRQHESILHSYYGYPYYWGDTGLWGARNAPSLLRKTPGAVSAAGEAPTVDDPHLRSINEVRGYHVHGSDKEVGHIHDFIVNDETWAVSYLVVNTSDWWLGNKVLIEPSWASRISWEQREVRLELPRQKIRDSPVWKGDTGINLEYETRLYDYYGRPKRWETTRLGPPLHVSAAIPGKR